MNLVKGFCGQSSYDIVGIMQIYLVIPTIRSLSFLEEWKDQFSQCSLIIVEDHITKEIVPPTKGFKKIYHYTWADIQTDFGTDEWIFPRKNAGIRSYGFWKAYALGADVVITLDDDCFPVETNFVEQHIDNLTSNAPTDWFPTFPHPDYLYTRGFPYDIRNKQKVVVSHGLWSNKMDMDAKTQIAIGEVNVLAYPPLRQFIPTGSFFAMSSMNLAFTREVLPLMYFPLMGTDPEGKAWGYDRYDDIWAGIFMKKILDHLGMSAVNGSPFVEHRKASDPAINLLKEKTGIEENERLWQQVQAVTLTKDSVLSCYQELTEKIIFPQTPYFSSLRLAMKIWAQLF